jgi:drug/metabolite transporter superfamily protein YnfA
MPTLPQFQENLSLFRKLTIVSFSYLSLYLILKKLIKYQVPLPTTGIFIVVALIWGWLSDGPCRGARWPFIYAGAVITVSKFQFLV